MMRGFAIFLAAISVCACGEDPPSMEESEQETVEDEKPVEPQVSEAVKAREEAEPDEPSQEVQLAAGAHSVYGLKMPRGMMPMKIPGETHRFEGTHSVTVLRRYIANQLENGAELKPDEKGECLLRGSKVKGSQSGEVLAVRIFKGSLGGGSVDVWLDDTGTLAAASQGGPTPTGTVHKRPPPPPSTYVKPTNSYERRKRTFNLMQKLERGEKIDDSELGDQFFY